MLFTVSKLFFVICTAGHGEVLRFASQGDGVRAHSSPAGQARQVRSSPAGEENQLVQLDRYQIRYLNLQLGQVHQADTLKGTVSPEISVKYEHRHIDQAETSRQQVVS